MEEKKSSGILKKISFFVIGIIVLVFFIAYYLLGWNLQAQLISPFLDATIKAVCTIVFAYYLSKIVETIIKKVNFQDKHKKTVFSLVSSIIKYAIYIVAFVLVLTYFISDTSSLFTGLGMLGMVIGLGCNKLIADVVAGIFIILENSFQVGDTVVINGVKGEIQSVGIKSTKLLDYANNVKTINNSSITNCTNWSQTTSGAMIEVNISYDESLERVESILEEALPQWKEEIYGIIAGPFYKGVVELGDRAVVLRILAITEDENRGKVKRAMLRKIKLLFDENGIEIPRTLYPTVDTKR